MTTDVAIPQSPMAPASRFTASSTSDSLLSKIQLVVKLFLAAGVMYGLYNISRCYQFIRNPSFQLDNELKLVKCKTLLDEIQEKLNNDHSTDVTDLLQECEALQSSMTPTTSDSHKQEAILLQLVHHYSEINSLHAYRIAERLSSESNLFEAARSIQEKDPTFGRSQLSFLFQKAFEALINDNKSQKSNIDLSAEVSHSLKYAIAFHSLKENKFKEQALDRAIEFANKCKNKLAQCHAFWKIAQAFKELGDIEQSETMINDALDLCSQITAPKDRIDAHIALANIFFSLNEYEKMDQALDQVTSLQSHEGIYSLARLIKEISDTNANSKYKTISAASIVNKAFENFQNSQSASNAKDYLIFANTYQALGMQEEAKKALNYAITAIESLPDSISKEIELKLDLLWCASLYEQIPEMQKMLLLLEQSYDHSPFDNNSAFCKSKIGRSILRFYNINNLTEESTIFFQKYLFDFTNQKNDASDQVMALTQHASSDLSPEQQRSMLEAAEGLISKVPSYHYVQSLAQIAKGYVKVDRHKSVALLNNYVNYRAVEHFGTAVITLIMVGILHVYPRQASAFLLPALTAYRIFCLF